MKKRKKRVTDLEFERNWWRVIADDFSCPIEHVPDEFCSASFRLGICSALMGLERNHNFSKQAHKIYSRCLRVIGRAFLILPTVTENHPYLFPLTLDGARQRVEFCEEQARRCTEQIRKKKAK